MPLSGSPQGKSNSSSSWKEALLWSGNPFPPMSLIGKLQSFPRSFGLSSRSLQPPWFFSMLKTLQFPSERGEKPNTGSDPRPAPWSHLAPESLSDGNQKLYWTSAFLLWSQSAPDGTHLTRRLFHEAPFQVLSGPLGRTLGVPGTFLVEPRNDKSGKEAIMHNSVLITELNKHYHSGFFFFFFR